MIRLCIIGGGITSAVGAAHVAALNLTGKYNLFAGCFSTDSVRNAEAGGEYGARPVGSIQELMALRPDRVVILSPTTMHRRHIENVAGYSMKHTPVLCEKALGVSSVETSWALGYSAPLSVVFNYAFYPAVQRLRQLVRDGELGEITHIHAEMPQSGYMTNKPQSWRLSDFGIYLDLGTHLHHLVWFLTGVAPVAVHAIERRLSGIGVVDYVSAEVRYPNFDANIWFSKASSGFSNGLRIRVFGTEGSAEWYQREPDVLMLSNAAAGTGHFAMEIPNPRFKAGHPTGFIEALANVYDAWADNPGHPDLSPAVAHEGLRLMEAMRDSALQEREVIL